MNVFVTVGTHTQSFDRLFKKLDELKAKHSKWRIFAQKGYTEYKPKNFKAKRFLNEKQYNEWFEKADLVVSHGGAGTIINAITRKKRLIIVPRIAEYKEHTNNHQVELALKVESKGLAECVRDINDLEQAILNPKKSFNNFGFAKQEMIREIKLFLNDLEKKLKR